MFFRYLSIAALVLSSALVQAQMISKIVVKGNQSISSERVISASGLTVGKNIDDTGSIIQKLNDQLDIENSTVSMQGGEVTIEIKELPRIAKITVNVSSGVSKDLVKQILKEYQVGVNQVLNYANVQKVAETITAYVERSGYNDVDVAVDYKILANNQAILTFDISSQEGYTISAIMFNGQNALSARQLEQISGLSTTGLLSPLTGDDYYSPARLQVAIESFKDAYANRGYYDVMITPSIQKIDTAKQVKITFNIKEGPITKIAKIDDKNLNKEIKGKLKAMGFEQGKPLSRVLVRNAEKAVANAFKDEGRYATDVNVVVKIVAPHEASIFFNVQKTPRVNIRFIQIQGNQKTEDRILRRYFDIIEGDLFSQTKVERSIQELKALAFLEEVKFKVIPVKGKKDQVDLVIQVKESSSSTISLKGSYDQRQGIIFSLQYSDKNFLGTGNLFSTDLERAANGKQSYQLSWFSPISLINSNWAESFNMGYSAVVAQTPDIDESERYKSTSFSFGISEYIPVAKHVNMILGFEPAFRRIENAKLNSVAYLFEQSFGQSFRTWGLKTGFKGQYYDESFGSWFGNLTLVYSPNVSQSVSYTKLSSRIEGSMKLLSLFDQNVVLNPIFKFGYGVGEDGDALPYFEKFQIGSDVTIRGFDPAKVGPYYQYSTLTTDVFGNATTQTVTDYVGGSQYAAMNLNVWLPSPSPETMVPGIYADIVNMTSENEGSGTRYAAGLAMKINSPMGPVQVAYALALEGAGDKDIVDRFWISMSGSL